MTKSFRHHGIDLDLHACNRTQSREYDATALGYSYHIPDINCALGSSQVGKLDGRILQRRQLAKIYNEVLSTASMLEVPTERSDCSPAWHLYVIRLRTEAITASRTVVFAALHAENIGVNVHYIAIPRMSYYAKPGYTKGNWPVVETEYERVIGIPLAPSMTDFRLAQGAPKISQIGTPKSGKGASPPDNFRLVAWFPTEAPFWGGESSSTAAKTHSRRVLAVLFTRVLYNKIALGRCCFKGLQYEFWSSFQHSMKKRASGSLAELR